MNRRLLSIALGLSAAAFIAAVGVHPAGAAPKAAATASPSPAPSPSATPEPLDRAIPRLESALKTDTNNKANATERAADYLQINRPDLALPLTQRLLQNGSKTAQVYYFDGLAQSGVGH